MIDKILSKLEESTASEVKNLFSQDKKKRIECIRLVFPTKKYSEELIENKGLTMLLKVPSFYTENNFYENIAYKRISSNEIFGDYILRVEIDHGIVVYFDSAYNMYIIDINPCTTLRLIAHNSNDSLYRHCIRSFERLVFIGYTNEKIENKYSIKTEQRFM